HAIVLAGFVSAADLSPSLATFDVFAADPIEMAPEPAQRTSLADAPRPAASTLGPNRASSPPRRSTPVTAPERSSARSADVVGPPGASVGERTTTAVAPEEALPASPGVFASTEPAADPAPAIPVVTPVQPAAVLSPAPEARASGVTVAMSSGHNDSGATPRPVVNQPENGQAASPGSELASGTTNAPAVPRIDEAVPAVAQSRRPGVASQVPAVPRRPSAPHGSSLLGLGLGALRIRLDGASMRTTERETDVISGTLIGGQPDRVVVQIEDRSSTPALAGRAFATAVKLSPGVNRVRVVATDADGAQAEETITIDYKLPATSGVPITMPRDGDKLAPDEPPLLTVEGEVRDSGVGTVWLVTNGRRISVPVIAGRFRHVLPVVEPLMRVRAETEIDSR